MVIRNEKGQFTKENKNRIAVKLSAETKEKLSKSNRFGKNPELQIGRLNHNAKKMIIEFEDGRVVEFHCTIEGKKYLADYCGFENYRRIENWIQRNIIPLKYNYIKRISILNRETAK